MEEQSPLSILTDYLSEIPAIEPTMSSETDEAGRWYLKFRLDILHPLAWRVVQELGNVVNLLSVNERLPTIFYPVSPPPYMNGGPEENLFWIIECADNTFKPSKLVEWLDARLPSPVDDEYAWNLEDEEEE